MQSFLREYWIDIRDNINRSFCHICRKNIFVYDKNNYEKNLIAT